jgi:hypothetical protein
MVHRTPTQATAPMRTLLRMNEEKEPTADMAGASRALLDPPVFSSIPIRPRAAGRSFATRRNPLFSVIG